MAIEFNDNIHAKVNRPTDFRFGPFDSVTQANTTIPIAQRYHGLIFGVYTNPLNIATSDVNFFYYWNALADTDVLPLGGKPPVDGEYVNQAAMIAAQASQTAQYIYYDNASYWEYLGTTNGNINDYRRISFNIVGPTTNGNVLTIVAGVPTWQAPVSTSKWTDLTGGIYRDSRVLVGNTTFSDSTSKFEVFGNAKIAASSGNFTPVLTIENTGSASWDFKNVTLFVGSRGNASIIDDNTNIGIWQKSAINNNYGLLNFFNAGGLLTAYFGARFLNHTNFQSSELHFGVFGAGVPISGLIIRSTGNVNIGGVSDSGNRLRVSGTVRLDSVTNATGDIVTIDANNVLRRRTVAEIGASIGSGNINTLGGVSITSPTNGQALLYNVTSQLWENGAIIGSKWTDTTGGIYRNGAVAIGRTTIPSNTTFAVKSVGAVDGNPLLLFERSDSREVLKIDNTGSVFFYNSFFNIGNPNANRTFSGLNVKTSGTIGDDVFRLIGPTDLIVFSVNGSGTVKTNNPSIYTNGASVNTILTGCTFKGNSSTSNVSIFRLLNSSNTIIFDVFGTGSLGIADSGNLILGTTTGTKIGTATSQKIGFWNATPIVQPTTAIGESAFVENAGGTAVNDDSTFDGYTLRQIVKALRDAGLLA